MDAVGRRRGSSLASVAAAGAAQRAAGAERWSPSALAPLLFNIYMLRSLVSHPEREAEHAGVPVTLSGQLRWCVPCSSRTRDACSRQRSDRPPSRT